MPKIDARIALDRLTNAMIDDILNMSDEEIMQEAIERGEDPQQLAKDMRARIKKILNKHQCYTTTRKITPELINRIKQAIHAKIPRYIIARHYSVGISTVYRIGKGYYDLIV